MAWADCTTICSFFTEESTVIARFLNINNLIEDQKLF